jgi:excisionase family DNA binding protein
MAWMTLGEAAHFLGVSGATLRKWTDNGMVPTFRTPGGHRRYLVDALIEFREGRVEENQPLLGFKRMAP